MKKRRTAIIAFLCLACLAIGIGYAAISITLEIAGSANVNTSSSQDDLDAHIEFTSATANSAQDSASIVSTNTNRATFTVNSIDMKDETATFTFVISSTYDKDVTLTPNVTLANTEEIFEVTTEWLDDKNVIAATDGVTPGTATITVTVRLKDNPTKAYSTASVATIDIEASVG